MSGEIRREHNGNGIPAATNGRNGIHEEHISYGETNVENRVSPEKTAAVRSGDDTSEFENAPAVVSKPVNEEEERHPRTSSALHVYDPEDDLLNKSFSDEEENAKVDDGADREDRVEADGLVLSVFKGRKSDLKGHRSSKTPEVKLPIVHGGGGDKLDARPYMAPRAGVPLAPAPQNFSNSYRYFMDHPRRGYAVIINNTDFTMENTPFRSGSDKDATDLQKTLLALGFEVGMFHNLNVEELRACMKYYSGMDKEHVTHWDRDCFLCAIFSHGEEGIIFGTDGKIALQELTSSFRGDRCLSLAGKPKIFIVQACRGEKLDSGVDMVEADAPCTYRVPAEADFLYAFATAPGYFAWRNTQLGSWFIQALCNALYNHASDPDMDLLKLLTRVNHEVAFAHESNVPSDGKWHRKKQIPSIVTMLTKEIYLAPKTKRMDTQV